MEILDRLIGQDAWATRHLLTLCRDMSDEQLDRPFDLGQGTLRNTFVHLVEVMESWTGRMYGRPWMGDPGPYKITRTMPALLARFEVIAADFAAIAYKARDENRLDDLFVDIRVDPSPWRTFGAGIVHIATHSMHHRAQVFAMLDWLGVPYGDFEGDALAFEAEILARKNQESSKLPLVSA